MKKLTGFIATAFITAVSYAQVPSTDSIKVPVMNGNNKPLAVDTSLSKPKLDTRSEWNNNNNNNPGTQWNKDSGTKKADQGNSMDQWKDTVAQNATQWNNGTQAADANQGLSDSAKSTQERISAEAGNQATEATAATKPAEAAATKTAAAAKKSEATTKMVKKPLTDRIMMKDGEMVIVKNGKEAKMIKSVTLENGSTVLTDGTIKLPDGNTMKLKDGEHIALGTTTKKATKTPAKKAS